MNAVELSRIGVEVWADIPGCEGYQASNLGQIKSKDREVVYMRDGIEVRAKFRSRILKPVRNGKSGHVNVTIGPRPRLIHSLVLLTFVGRRPKGLMTRHLDGKSANNALFNLVYGTASENRYDDVRNGLYGCRKGSGAANVKLSESDVADIRDRLKQPSHGLVAEIAREYGVSWGTIGSIRVGRNWGHLKEAA